MAGEDDARRVRDADPYESKHMSGGGEILHREKMVGGRGWRAALLGVPVGTTVAVSLPAVLAQPSAVSIGFTIGGALLASVPYLLFSVLRVTVSTETVHVQFGLWGPKIPIASVLDCEAVAYDWKDYGGFGIKRSRDGAWIYNMIGDQARAVRIRWMDGGEERVHLVSAKDPDALVAAIREARARAGLAEGAPRVRVAVEGEEDELEVTSPDGGESRRRAR